jgi:hypothetical protein
MTRADERRAWLSSKAYQRVAAEAREEAKRDPNHRKLLERIRATVMRSREALAEGAERIETATTAPKRSGGRE